MNRGQARTLLRHRLHDEPGDRFDDSELDDYLNLSLYNLQADINEVNDQAFYGRDTTALQENDDLYDLPANNHIYRVAWKAPGATSYKKLTFRQYHPLVDGAEGNDSPSDGERFWTRIGNKLLLSWLPTAAEAAVAGGLKIEHSPLIALSDDVDVPTHIHLGLHLLWVVDAQLIAIGETEEDSEQIQKVRDRLAARIPRYYQWQSHEQERLWIDPDLLPEV